MAGMTGELNRQINSGQLHQLGIREKPPARVNRYVRRPPESRRAWRSHGLAM